MSEREEPERHPEEEEEFQEREAEQIAHEVEAAHAEGDLRTWLILGAIAISAVLHTVAIYLIVGRGIAGPNAWNLGWPPTSPYVVWPF